MIKTLAKVDQRKNRIYLTFDGFMTLEDAKELKAQYGEAIAQCRPGFTVLTDATNYIPGTPEVQRIVASMAKLCEDGGCRKVARVVGDKPLGGMQIARMAKAETRYPSKHFQTFEEAEEYLDEED